VDVNRTSAAQTNMNFGNGKTRGETVGEAIHNDRILRREKEIKRALERGRYKQA
jgi:hypothetical protein